MAGGGGSSGGFESYLPIAAALAATVMTDGAAAPLLEESLGATGAAAVTGAGIGAVTGGGVAALTGQNVMQNALMGGIGGAGIGASGMYMGAGDVAAGAPTAVSTSGAAVSPTVAAADTTGVQAGSNAALNAGYELPVAPGTTLGTATPQMISQGVASGQIPMEAANAYGQAYTNAFANVPANSVLGAAGTGTEPLGFGAKAALGGLGLSALIAQDNKRYGGTAAAAVPYTGDNLSKFHYDPANYHPDVVQPPRPPYQADYSGYARPPGYAGGGLLDPHSEPVDFMGGGMYPQSQQVSPAYATPTQMPTSAQQTAALYEPKTNPLTGEMTANMAAGGTGKDALADLMSSRDAMDKYTLQYAQEGGPAALAAKAQGGDYNAMLALNKLRGTPNANYASGGVVAFDNGGQAQLTPDQMAKMQAQATQQQASQYDPYSELQQQAMYARMAGLPQITPTSSAQGGLLSSYASGGGISSLGGYSDGGRMLKGPGDGMSDSIPASIQGKQPARLADNEFVVPADVVSHLGNGSSDAGAKKLYAMMSKVRKARTGKAKQAPAIKADKYMPA